MHYTVHLTKECSMRCSYCYSPPQSGNAMSSDTAAAAIDFISRNAAGNTGIVFFGGEPLLRKDLIIWCIDRCKALEHPSQAYYHFKVSTNGLALDREFIDYATGVPLTIALSIDGDAPAHNTHRRSIDGHPTSGPVTDAARLLLERQPYAPALMVITPETVDRYASSLAFLVEEIGFRYVIASLNYAGAWSDDHLGILKKQYLQIAGLYEKWTREERKFYYSPFERVFASRIRGREHVACNRCALGVRQLSIDPDGTIFPCIQFVRDPEYAIGDVWSGIDENRRQALSQNATLTNAACEACDYRYRCENSCSCLNWQTTGSLSAVSPVLCETERILIPVADRLGEKLYRSKSPMFMHKQYNPDYPFLSLLEDDADA